MAAFRRIHIIGGAGSGKTTLADEYAARYELPHHELDYIQWLDVAEWTPRPQLERDRMLQAVVSTESWVVDGIFWQDWVIPSFERADVIVVLNIAEWRRHYHVVKRHIQLLMKAERSAYPTFFPTLLRLLKLNREYEKGPYQKTQKVLSRYTDKVVVCANVEEVRKLTLE